MRENEQQHYNVVILLQSYFLLLHLWMSFFNEAEDEEASNVQQCGMMKYPASGKPKHTYADKYIVWSFLHTSFSILSQAFTQKLIPLITDLHKKQHNRTGGPPWALLPPLLLLNQRAKNGEAEKRG